MTVRRFYRRIAAGLTLFGSVIGSASAQQPLPPFDLTSTWTGAYLGAAFGGAMMENGVTSSTITVDREAGQGILASIYGGVDYQILPRAVVGALIEATWSNAQGAASAAAPTLSASLTRQADLGWSALVRAGVLPSPSTLLYFMGGYSGQNIHSSGSATANGNAASFDRNDYFNGWTIGTGVETMLGDGWSTKLEYRYSQFETKSVAGFNVAPALHTVRAGLTYRFGGAGGPKSEDAAAATTDTDWTGFYLGVGGGGSATRNRLSATFGNASSTIDEGGQDLLGSAFGGFDWQLGKRAVVGVMGDFTVSGPQSTSTVSAGGANLQITTAAHSSWSALGRVGFLPTPSTLIYAAAGYTAESITTSANASVGNLNAQLWQNDVVGGWTVAPGIETIISGGWSTRLEYRYSQFEQKTINGANATVQPNMQSLWLGLSYKFGTGTNASK